MSSLVTSASIWSNDDNSNKKRTPTLLRKTIKKPLNGEPPEYENPNKLYQTLEPQSLDDVQNAAQDRNSKVTSLLDKITSADTSLDNNKLGNFNPIAPPTMNVKKDITDNVENKPYVSMLNLPTNKQYGYGANEQQNVNYSNYLKSYEPPKPMANQPYYAKMGLGQGATDDKLMEKINYMIHLLEEQQNEKTNHITEEFILYTFLGVFVIFIVDSFARSGKYTR
jgi:hypothetical protein